MSAENISSSSFDASAFDASWNYPTAVRTGLNAARELSQFCSKLTINKPLLVTDPGMIGLPVVTDLIEHCSEQGLDIQTFSNLKGNPNGANVEEGVRAFKTGDHDGVIALGGGSALDTAKAIALMAGQDRPLWDFEDVGDNWTRVNEAGVSPVIAIPTTAGTGSEVGRASVITYEEEQRKVIIFHPKMLPVQVILDPALTVGLPAHITAATGMDALSHSLEAYCATYYHPMAEGIAIESMRLVAEYLPRAYQQGDDLEARQQMLVASSMGATAFQRGLGAMHALAHSLGALYDSHHGLLNAILMPYVLVANRTAIEEKITHLARCMNLETHSFDGFMTWLMAFREELAIPNTLSEIGITKGQEALIGEMAVADPSAGGNPILFTAEQYQPIFLAALEGNMDALSNLNS